MPRSAWGLGVGPPTARAGPRAYPVSSVPTLYMYQIIKFNACTLQRLSACADVPIDVTMCRCARPPAAGLRAGRRGSAPAENSYAACSWYALSYSSSYRVHGT